MYRLRQTRESTCAQHREASMGNYYLRAGFFSGRLSDSVRLTGVEDSVNMHTAAHAHNTLMSQHQYLIQRFQL